MQEINALRAAINGCRSDDSPLSDPEELSELADELEGLALVARQQATERAEELADEYDYDDSMDGDHESALASAGWGTDEDYGGGCEYL